MAHRVVLHAGLMKSGTTYLQRRLYANRDLLNSRGVLFPGKTWRQQVLAVSDVLERTQGRAASAGRWSRLVEETTAYDGTVLVSMEFLGPARPDRIAKVVGSWDDTPVEAILTLRDLGRGVPAMWQESLQNGGSVGWREYVDSLGRRRKPARAFWRQQGMARIVENWVDALGPERVTIVTVPPPHAEPDLLWDRFCEAARIDGVGTAQGGRANTSLDAASALVLRELNLRLAKSELSLVDYHRLVKFGLAKTVMAARGGPTIGFTPSPWLVGRSVEIAARLRASGARIVGDLAELEPLEVPGVDPDLLSAEDRFAAAVDVLHRLTMDQVKR